FHLAVPLHLGLVVSRPAHAHQTNLAFQIGETQCENTSIGKKALSRHGDAFVAGVARCILACTKDAQDRTRTEHRCILLSNATNGPRTAEDGPRSASGRKQAQIPGLPGGGPESLEGTDLTRNGLGGAPRRWNRAFRRWVLGDRRWPAGRKVRKA